MTNPYEQRDGVSQITQNPAATVMNVVFVHGLGGGAYSTWFSKDSLEFWPEKFARDHPACCVWTLHYTANILERLFAKSPTMDLLDRAAWFLEQLVLSRVPDKPIVFVAHSLGGVLVKQALQFSSSLGPARWRPVWEQTYAVFFLATPHVGSQLANVATILANYLRNLHPLSSPLFRPSRALANLEKNNPTLRYLTDWYKDHAPAHGIETRAFRESKALGPTLVVDEAASSPQVADCVVCPVVDDHLSIAKPTHTKHEVYAALSECVGGLEKALRDGDGSKHRRKAGATLEKELADRLTGNWWERITRPGDPTAISFCTIDFNSTTNQVAIRGDGYGPDGVSSSKWESILGRITENAHKELVLQYFWKGELLRYEGTGKNPEFSGFGELTFARLADGSVKFGLGHYWNVDETNPENTRYKRVEMKRVSDGHLIKKMSEAPLSERQLQAAAFVKIWDTL